MTTSTFRLIGIIMAWLLLVAWLPGRAQCVIDSLVPNVPGIYPDTLADAVGCEFYEVDITFFLPRDTTVVFAGNQITIPFNSFTIDSLVGLPDGLSWTCNLDSLGCFYDVNPNNPSPDTLGCIRVFGTPTAVGYFAVDVYLTANADVLGNPTDQEAIFDASIVVTPCAFAGACYTSQLNDICAGAELSTANNIPSNGDSRYSYNWTLSNDGSFNFQSTDENIPVQTLSEAGTYILNYTATVDTFPYTLTGVTIDSIGCDDLLDAADIYWKLFDPQGVELISTLSNPISNGGDNLPIITGIGPLVLDSGTYEFQVWDDDLIGQDEGCATGTAGSGASVFFTIPAPSGNVTITNNALRVIFAIDHPVQVISCADTFQIDSLPPIPMVVNTADTNILCMGDTLALMAANADSVQWFQDGQALNGETDMMLGVFEAGTYAVESIDLITGCRSRSTDFVITMQQIAPPSIAYDGSASLSVAGPNPAYRYDWYDVDDGLIGSGTSISPSGSGNFFAIAVDTTTNCESAPSVTIQAILASIEHLSGVVDQFELFPNPAHDQVQLNLRLKQAQSVDVQILDLSGRIAWQRAYGQPSYSFQESLPLGTLARGIYLVQVRLEAGTIHQKLVLR